PPTDIYSLSLHDALPIYQGTGQHVDVAARRPGFPLAIAGPAGASHWRGRLSQRSSSVHMIVGPGRLEPEHAVADAPPPEATGARDRKSTRLNSSHGSISY